jgi:hypothetical protein
MKKHEDGSITEMPYVKAATMPKNCKQEDSLLNMSTMSNEDREWLVTILEHHIADYERKEENLRS